MTDARQQLNTHLAQIGDLQKSSAILGWDQEVMMPPEAAEDRGRMMATLSAISHEKATDPRIMEWIEQITPESEWEKRDLKLLREDYAIATALPGDLVFALEEQKSRTVTLWQHNKAESNWNAVKPELEKFFALILERAKICAEVLKRNTYDAQLFHFARGNTIANIDPLFDMLKTELPPLVQQIVDKQADWPKTEYSLPIDVQRRIARQLAESLGYSFAKGRLDEAAHPFSGGTKYDSRMTTRYNKNNPFSGFLGVIHETGHALYTQNLPEKWQDHPVGADSDLSIHESQSLVFEKQAGLSESALRHLHDLIIREDAEFSVRAPLDEFKQHLYTVRPNFIRVDADEASYPLHVILRYELEKDLFSGALAVRDIPEAWNAKFKTFLGLDVPEHKLGCMQDIHWYWGLFGYFPTYTQGALYAAQLMDAVKRDIPDVETQFGKGDFTAFREWLTEHVHQYGQLYDAPELIARATGAEPSASFFLDHLKNRYL